MEIGASYDLRKQSLVLKDLNVEVRCDDGDERVHKVLDVLGSYGLSPEKFKIQRPPKLTRARFDDTWTSGSKFSVGNLYKLLYLYDPVSVCIKYNEKAPNIGHGQSCGTLPKSELKDDVGLAPFKTGDVTKLVQKNGVLNVAILIFFKYYDMTCGPGIPSICLGSKLETKHNNSN